MPLPYGGGGIITQVLVVVANEQTLPTNVLKTDYASSILCMDSQKRKIPFTWHFKPSVLMLRLQDYYIPFAKMSLGRS